MFVLLINPYTIKFANFSNFRRSANITSCSRNGFFIFIFFRALSVSLW